MRYSYSIIDTIISIEEQIWTDKVLRKFSVKKEKQNELEIRGISEKMYSGNIQLFNIEKWHYNMFRFNSDVMFVDLEKKRGDIVLPFFEQRNVVTLIMQLFYANVIKKKVLQLHASIIEKNAYGIMFLGPSGIGKTTQAELWNKFCDALIINGDIVFVEEKENVFLGWGTPWHGSSPYCENTFVPVKALVVLKQASKNSIRELDGGEKVKAVSESVFYPRWLENGMELCLETLDHLLSSLPVYELSCRPDEDAVRLTEKTIFN